MKSFGKGKDITSVKKRKQVSPSDLGLSKKEIKGSFKSIQTKKRRQSKQSVLELSAKNIKNLCKSIEADKRK